MMELVGVCLITKNVIALSSFYSKILGIEAKGNEEHMEISTQGAGIAIFSKEGMENMAPGSVDGMGYGGVTIMIKVKDVDNEFERLKTLNVEFVKQPETYPWGSRSFWIKDLDGNIIDFFSSQTV